MARLLPVKINENKCVKRLYSLLDLLLCIYGLGNTNHLEIDMKYIIIFALAIALSVSHLGGVATSDLEVSQNRTDAAIALALGE